MNRVRVESSDPAQETLAAAFQHATIGIATADADGRLRDGNPAFLRMLGLTREELLNRFIIDVTHADDHASDAELWSRLLRGESDAYQREKRYLRKGGSSFWALVTVSALRDDAGQFLGSMAQIQDITAQKSAEAALRENEAKLESLVGQLPILFYRQPWGGVFDITYASPRFEETTGLTRKTFPGDLGSLLALVHPEDRDHLFTVIERSNRTGESAQAQYRLMGAHGDWVWLVYHAILLRDEQGSPLAWHGSVIDITERKTLEASLQESQVRSRLAFENAAIGMTLADANDMCLDVNEAYCQIVGIPRDELIGRSLSHVTHPDDRKASQARLAAFVSGEADHLVTEKRYLRPDGRTVIGRLTASAVRNDDGSLRYFIAQLQDITAQKLAETALRESEDLLRTVIERAPAAVYRLEPGAHGRFTFGSPRFRTMTGLAIDGSGQTIDDFFARVHPDDLERVRAADAEAAALGQRFDTEYRLSADDGSWIWVHDRSSPTRDQHGTITAWHGMLLDVSERRRLQEALQQSEAQLRLLVEQLPVALFSLERAPSTHYAFVSPQFGALTGMSPEEIAQGDEALFARMHPADILMVRESARRANQTLEPHQTEYRLRNNAGEWVWLQERAMMARDGDGRPLAWHGVLIDISKRKAAEAALRESEARLQSLVEHLPVALYSVDSTPKGRYFYTSPQFESLTGMTPAELELGTTALDDRIHPDDLPTVQAEWDRTGASGEPFEMTFRVLGSDGEWRWVNDRATPMCDDGGHPLAWHGVLLDVSAQRRLEATLRESEERFRSTFEGAGIGMSLVDARGGYIDVNPAFCQFLGRSRDEILTKTFMDVTHPHDLERNIDRVQALRAGVIDTYAIEKRYIRPGGAFVWGHLTVTAIRGPEGEFLYEIAQIQDVTARKQAEAALRESEARFRAVVQHDPDVISIVSSDMEITYISPTAEEAFGAPLETMFGPLAAQMDRVHADDQERTLALFSRVGGRQGAIATTEARIWHEKLGWRWFQITIADRLETPGIEGYLFNLRDITERKQAELATEAALRSQQSAIDELERLSATKSRFLSTISHEFRTPLTAIIGYSEYLASNAGNPEEVSEDAATIHREASRLNRMIGDLLLIDSVDAGRLSLHARPLNLNTLVEAVTKIVRPITATHAVVLDLQPGLHQVAGDYDRIAQAITNLLSNAVKYSPNGGVITVASRNQDGTVVVSVRDEGIGIAPEDQQRIFERFERVESGIAGRVAGTGLGLSIVREIADLHCGSIRVISTPGLGSCFSLAIPALADDGACPAEPEATGYTPYSSLF